MQEFKDATAMAQAVRKGEVSSVELVQDALFKVKQLNPTLNAVGHLQEERAKSFKSEKDMIPSRF